MSEPSRSQTVEDLERLSRSNATVRVHLYAWRHGSFASFEQCLVALAVELAGANERLAKGAAQAWLHASSTKGRLFVAPLDLLQHEAAIRASQRTAAKVIRDLMYPPPINDVEPPVIVEGHRGE